MNKKIFSNKYFWWGLGLIIVLIATSVEVFRGRNTNYFDYQDSTRMFWEGLSPYNLEYAQAHQIYFLYSPVFSVIFAPIFYLPWWLGPYVWNIGNYTLFGTSATIPCSHLPSNGYHSNSRNINFISLYSCCQ